jgi:hypothetical protein
MSHDKMGIIKNKRLYEEIFKIDDNIKLTIDDINYMSELSLELEKYVLENGTESETTIKEIITDTLLKDERHTVLKFLSLDFTEKTTKRAEDLVNLFKIKIELSPSEKDFFKSYLIDDTLDDINMTIKGYIKSIDGTKEIYIKNKSAITLTDVIDVINTELLTIFNKINFMGDKEDEEISEMIIFSLNQIGEILEDLPFEVCTTQDTRMILTIVATKLVNIIGYVKDNRKTLFESLNESYKSRELSTDKEKNIDRD